MRFVFIQSILTLLFAAAACGAEISFAELKNAQGERIELRGFLYQAPDGELILAEEPDLKSCCVGSKEKNQVAVRGLTLDKIPKNQALCISGRLQEGESFQYALLDAALVPHERKIGGAAIAFATVMAALLLVIRWRLRRPHRSAAQEKARPAP